MMIHVNQPLYMCCYIRCSWGKLCIWKGVQVVQGDNELTDEHYVCINSNSPDQKVKRKLFSLSLIERTIAQKSNIESDWSYYFIIISNSFIYRYFILPLIFSFLLSIHKWRYSWINYFLLNYMFVYNYDEIIWE